MSQISVIIPTPSGVDAQRINVVVHVTADVLSPDVAWRRASGWLLDNVGNLLHAETPELVAGEKILWRSRVVLTSPSLGYVGILGMLDLDATSGEVLADSSVIEQFHAHAARLAQR